jgi:hypothetical protein
VRFRSLALLALAAPALAQDEGSYRQARIRHAEPMVSIERAAEATAEEAMRNMPFLPGDRLFTDGSGRAELQLDDGTILRVDSGSKLDFGDDARGLAFRLWSGGLYIEAGRDPGELLIQTPGGDVEPRRRGVYRLDVAQGEVRLSVYEGEAVLDSGRGQVTVGDGERSYAVRGESPERVERFDRREQDEFARWNDERARQDPYYASDDRRYLPEEVYPYAGELQDHGSWRYEAEIGFVWYPAVAAGWRPYADGQWVWTHYGWTWVPYESWGWATSHFGRWGWSPGMGWYWIPGGVWGPAWVSWAVGPEYVGWCPLGWRDRPVLVHGTRKRGYAVPRRTDSGRRADDAATSGAWVITRKADMTARDVGRRRIEVPLAELPEVRIMDSPRLRPARDLARVVDTPAPSAPLASRRRGEAIMTKPVAGDWVQELRHDNKVTIPPPMPRSKPRTEEPTEQREQRALRPVQEQGSRPTDRRGADRSQGSASRERLLGTTQERSQPSPASESAQRRMREPDGGREPARAQEQRRREDGDSVMKRFFEPATNSRSRGEQGRSGEGGSSGGRSRPEAAAPRNEPRNPPPPPRVEAPRNPPQAKGAMPRATPKPEKDKH